MANLDKVFQAFAKLAGAKNPVEETRMNSKTCEKMVKECLPKGVVQIADACIFPLYKERNKPYFLINNFRHFVQGCAYEYAKKKRKDPRIQEGDSHVNKYYQEFTHRLLEGKPDAKRIKASKNTAPSNMKTPQNAF